MKTHNRIIYHCLHCGKVVHAEPDEKPPKCCGKEMRSAAGETVPDSVPRERPASSRSKPR